MTDSVEAAIEAVQKTLRFGKLESSSEIAFHCPRGWAAKYHRCIYGEGTMDTRQINGITFQSAPDYAFFTGIRQVLARKHGERGAFLANLLAATLDGQYAEHSEDYDDLCKAALREIKMVSVADPDGGTCYDTNVPQIVRRWGVNHTNLSPYSGNNIDISADSPDFIRMNDPKNNRQADFVWACNVVSYPAVRGADLDAMEKQAQVYQTFAALTEMVKPTTGQLLLVSTLDRNVHYSIEADIVFHRMLGLERSNRIDSSRCSLFTRNAETKITELQLTRHVADSEREIYMWSSLG